MESVSGVGEHHVEMTAQDTDTHKGSGYWVWEYRRCDGKRSGGSSWSSQRLHNANSERQSDEAHMLCDQV
jgi:hypothetical protein